MPTHDNKLTLQEAQALEQTIKDLIALDDTFKRFELAGVDMTKEREERDQSLKDARALLAAFKD